MVERGVNLTELDGMTGCMATYPNYLEPERMRGPDRFWENLRGTTLFPAPSCKAHKALKMYCSLHRGSVRSSLPGVVQTVRLAFIGPIKD